MVRSLFLRPLLLLGLLANLPTPAAAQALTQVRQLGGGGLCDVKNTITDEQGSIYAIGTFSGTIDFDPSAATRTLRSASAQDIFLAKYDAEGGLVFVNHIEVATRDSDTTYAGGITLDADKNVFISASFKGDVTLEGTTLSSTLRENGDDSRDILFARYDADGTLSFAYRMGGDQTDYGYDLATTADNKIVLLGRFKRTVDFDPGHGGEVRQAAFNGTDIYLAHYNPNGSLDRVATLGGDNFQMADHLAIDGQGNYIIAGFFQNRISFRPGTNRADIRQLGSKTAFVAKYDADLGFEFAVPFVLPQNQFTEELAITTHLYTDANDNILVTGGFTGPLRVGDQEFVPQGKGADIYLARINAGGTLDFVRRYGGPGDEAGRAVTVGPDGTYYLLGNFAGALDLDPGRQDDNLTSQSDTDGFLARLNERGDYLGVQAFRGSGPVTLKQLVRYPTDPSALLLTGMFGGNLALSPSTTLTSSGEVDIFFAYYDLSPPPPAPELVTTALSAYQGQAGDTLRLQGQNFGAAVGDNTVTVGDAEAEVLSVNAERTELSVRVPPLALGSYPVAVTVGNQTAVAPQPLTVSATPVVDQTPPAISLSVPARLRAGDTNLAVSSTVTDVSALREVTLEFLPIRQNPGSSAWRRLATAQDGTTNTYLAQLNNTDLDELGGQIRVVATDVWGNSDTSAVRYTYREYSAAQPLRIDGVQPAKATPSPNDYRLLAVPLQNQSARQVLGPLGDYDTRRWRFWRLRDGSDDTPYQELNEGWSGEMEAGRGYMLIYTEATAFQATGAVVEANHEAPYTITLQPGYNLIGNPYPFALDWQAVLAFNELEATALRLKTFERGFREATQLEPFAGGLVVNPNAGQPLTLMLPVRTEAASGRTGAVATKNNATHWTVPFTLNSDGLSAPGRVGMHPAAQPGFDRRDDFPPPRLTDFLEVSTAHPEFFLSAFSDDVVPPAPQHRWAWKVATDQGNRKVTLRWDPADVAQLTEPLTLLDPARARQIDMRTLDHYTFRVDATGSHAFELAYGSVDEPHTMDGMVRVGEAYPNPVTDRLHLPVWLPDGETSRATLEIFDRTGRWVGGQTYDQLSPGYHTLVWHRNGTLPMGLYLCRLSFGNREQTFIQRALLE